MKESMGQFSTELEAGGWGKAGPGATLTFQPWGINAGEPVYASELLATEREVDNRVAEIKASLDAAAATAKAALRRG